jgi:hypothetical protein
VTLHTLPGGDIPYALTAGPARSLWALTDTRIVKITVS